MNNQITNQIIHKTYQTGDWTDYFFSMIPLIKFKSKDPNTKVGCIIVGEGKQILSTGYNSFPRGLNDDIPERLERPEKYIWIEHAERNAIYNAVRSGICLLNSTIYMESIPCNDCARAIIQSGIKTVVYNSNVNLLWNSSKYNDESLLKSVEMLLECGVEIIEMKKEM